MKLPGGGGAVVSRGKVLDYLLSPSHPQGRYKAAVFLRHGFTRKEWTIFADALRAHAVENEVCREETSPFGRRFVVEGILKVPEGRAPMVRTVWFVERGDTVPRLVTAYAVERREGR